MKQTEQERGVTHFSEASGLRRCEPQRKRTGGRSLETQQRKVAKLLKISEAHTGDWKED